MTPGHYAGPVILATDQDSARKIRHIDIFKNEVYKDIDLFTHKHVDSREDLGARAANAISSDNSEKVDGAIMARLVDFRDSELRVAMQSCLVDVEDVHATDNIEIGSGAFVYWLNVYDEFNDNTLRPLAQYIHRYLVWGALFDWYSQIGSAQAERYGREVEKILDNIESILRGPSIVKRPMQPFGPAQKMED